MAAGIISAILLLIAAFRNDKPLLLMPWLVVSLLFIIGGFGATFITMAFISHSWIGMIIFVCSLFILGKFDPFVSSLGLLFVGSISNCVSSLSPFSQF